MNLLTFDDGVVTINGEAVDAILTSLSISGEVKFSDEPRDGMSGTVKTPMGWSDADIAVTMDLITDDTSSCYDRLAKLNAVFKARDKGPKVFDIVNRHLAARGIRQIVFAKFDSSESNQDDVISVSMSFVEYEPAVVPAEIGESRAGNGTDNSEATSEPETLINVSVY